MKILTQNDSFLEIEQQGGGKAKNLKKLLDQGCPIPQFLVIADDFFQDFISQNNLGTKLKLTDSPSDDAKRIQSVFENISFSNEQKEKLSSFLKENGLSNLNVAVRSSGLDEDSADHSFAGMFSSFLFQKTDAQIERSIINCWASAFSERCLSYRLKNGLSSNIQMGVIVQKMINSDSSGVLFTRNPIDFIDRDNIIIESVYGQCEGLVSGELDSDKILFSRLKNSFEADIAQKESYFIKNDQSGILKKELEDERQTKLSIDEKNIQKLASLAIELEKKQGCPLDLEWAIEDHELYLVQMRPITNCPPLSFYDSKINGDEATLWDNSNIVESFAGITLPLTFSLTKEAYAIVYRQTCRLIGVPENIITDNDEAFVNMLGHIRGRVYYNLINWYKLLFLFPGSSSNKGFMETMMGVQEELSQEQQGLLDFVDKSPKYTFFRKLFVFGGFFKNFLYIKTITKDFRLMFDTIYNEYFSIDFSKKSLRELKAYFERWNDTVSYNWNAPIINDFLVMVFFGTLKSLVEKWIKTDGDSAHLQNDLLCGQGEVDSTLPTLTLMKIASEYDQDATLKEYFANTSTEEILIHKKENKLPFKFKNDLEDYLIKYGFRCNHEQKLEGEDLHSNPSFIIDNIRNYIKTKSYSVEKMHQNEVEIKEKAESIVNSQLSGLKRIIFYWVLNKARFFVKNRENLRFLRSKSFGISRRIFKTIASHLEALDIIEKSEDAFYLTAKEIFDFIEGKSEYLNFKEVAKIRKKEYAQYFEEQDPPDRFITFGANGVSLSNTQVIMSGDLLKNKFKKSDDPNLYYGTSCCPGVIKKKVVVAKTIEEANNMNGEILVTKRTDPGWVPLFPLCGGLIIERGSLLSHSAVIARELGVPTIVGIDSELIDRLNTGDTVELNATTGEVRVCDED